MKVAFFCGHLSRYGLAHLEPVLQNFDVQVVVAATDQRWAYFRERLSGESFQYSSPWAKAGNAVRGLARDLRSRATNRHPKDVSFESICRRYQVPIWWIDDVNDHTFVERMVKSKTDLIISAAYPQIFSAGLLGSAPQGGINFHPSALPRCRGAHPHFWAIATGEPEGGVTAHYMTASLDDGPIIGQIRFPIGELYYSEHYRVIIEKTPALVRQVAEAVGRGDAPTEQTGPSSQFRNDREIHRRLFWNKMEAGAIHNLIRTESAFCLYRERPVRIPRAKLLNSNRNATNGLDAEPGVIVDINRDHLVVAANGGYIGVISLSDGRGILSHSQWVAKHGTRIGERFS
jgi:methionyl-tRNA formyltransferase